MAGLAIVQMGQSFANGLSRAFASLTLRPFPKIKAFRTTPTNLTEQLKMAEAKSNPSAGVPAPSGGGMKDPRWHGDDGWVKMRNKDDTVHWVWNKMTNAADDFKFNDK